MSNGADEQGKSPSNNTKGKGRGRENDSAEEQQYGSGSLISSIMQSARSSVNPSNMSNLMTVNGKATTGLPSSSSFEDSTRLSVSHPSSQARQFPFSHRHNGIASEQRDHDDAYNQFAEMGASRINLGIQDQLRSESSAFIGPFSSAEELDVPLHDHVRRCSSQWSEMDDAWKSHSEGVKGGELPSVYDYASDEAWARSVPALSGSRYNDMQRGQSIDELLQTVSLSSRPTLGAGSANVDNGTSTDFMILLEEEEDRATLPSQEEPNVEMSDEQARMHSALHDLQNSKERAGERIQAPNDDAMARTGMYAATPQEALQAIWNGPAEGERASALVRNDSRNSQESMTKKIRELLKRGSYVDDVYGIPPQLQGTIVAAEEEETEQNKEQRNIAIRRLDALYKHLGAAGPCSDKASVDDFIRNW